MPRIKRYIDKDVVEAARDRLRHVYDIFDNVVYMYSGGKDSSCCLILAKEIHEEYGLGPVECVFRDGETLPFSSIEILEWAREQPWVNLRWQCFPRRDDRLVLGGFRNHIRWDPERKWTRPMPEWAEKIEDHGFPPGTLVGEGGVDQDEITASSYKGSVAFVTGIRAAESLVRFRSVVNKLNENYINRIEGNATSRIRMVKPIYDWLENDVLKFLQENDFPLATMYHGQEMVGSPLRVGPPLGQASKRIGWLREIEPEFYQATVEAFPDMLIQDRYFDEFDSEAFTERYSDGFDGVRRYVDENVPDGPNKDKLYWRIRKYEAMHSRRPEDFPIWWLLKETMNGATERKIRGIDSEAKKNKQIKRKLKSKDGRSN